MPLDHDVTGDRVMGTSDRPTREGEDILAIYGEHGT